MSRLFTPTLISRHPLAVALSRAGRSWAVASQERACRNAMAASTVLAARRSERIEVEQYLRAALARREEPAGVTALLPAPRVG